MVVVEVFGIDRAVAVQIRVEALDGHSRLVVDLLIDVVAVGFVALGKHLHVVRLDGSGRRVGRLGFGVQAQVGDLVALVGCIGRHIPLPVGCTDGSCADRHLEALALDVAHVAQHLLVEVRSGSDGHCGQEVFGLAVVVVERTGDAVADEAEVEAVVPRLGGLPRQVAVVGRWSVGLDRGAAEHVVGAALAFGVEWQVAIVGDAVLLACHAVARSEFQHAERRLETFEEVLFRHAPAKCHRRERAPAVVFAES